MEDITFTIEDEFEDSLLKPLMKGLCGEITLRFDPENIKYYSVNHPIDFKVYLSNINGVIYTDSSMDLMFIICGFTDEFSNSSNNFTICTTVFKKCLLEIEKAYRTSISDHEVRKYPIYQILENYFTSGNSDDWFCDNEMKKPWKGFILDFENIYHKKVIIKRDEEILFTISEIDGIATLMDEMKAGTADPILYELPIERMKSARKTE
jgi:hypothetical protein